ncbi:MAG: Lrp/AsnC family transcriptional regulator [Actinomycetota bacterium]
MDRLDHEILAHLSQDGRLTNAELARRIRLSPTPTLRRVKALEADGVITGYHAAVSPTALGRGFEVLVAVDLHLQVSEELERFEAAVAELDEVVEAHRIYGTPDYLLRVAVADNAAYERLYADRLVRLPGVARATSQMIMKSIKAPPLPPSTSPRNKLL